MEWPISSKMAAFFVMILLLCPVVMAEEYPYRDSMSAYYTFDTDASDSTANNNDGTVQGSVAHSATGGVVGGYYDFPGSTSDYITFPDDNSLDFGTGSFTISAWINDENSAQRCPLNKFYVNELSNPATGWYVRIKNDDSLNPTTYEAGTPSDESVASYFNGATFVMMTWVFDADAGRFLIYKNGTLVSNSTETARNVDTTYPMVFGKWSWTNGDAYPGNMDEVGLWKGRVLSTSEVGTLYDAYLNGSNAWNYSVEASSEPYAHVRVQDLYDSANLEGINVTLNDGTVNVTDASGIAYFYNKTGQTFTVNESALYFSTTGTAVENSTTTAQVYGAFVTLEAYDLFGSSVSNFTVTSGSQTNTTTDGDTELILRPNASNSVLFESTGYFNVTESIATTGQDTGTYNTTGLHDSIITIQAIDQETSLPISNFTLNISQENNSYSESYTTSNGTVYAQALQGWDFLLVADASGYAISNYTMTVDNTTKAYNFTLYTTNSVSITIYDEYTSNQLDFQQVDVTFTKGNSSTDYNTNDGELYVDLLDPGTWQLEFSSNGYDDRLYFITVGSRSHQFLNAYLLNSTLSQDTQFTIKTVDGDFITNATITMQQQINGTYVTIDQEVTDFFGQAFFALQYNEDYKIIIEANGYITKTATFKRISSTYSITLTPENTQNYVPLSDEFTYSTSPDEVSPEPTNFTLSTSSPDGRLEWFYIKINLNGTDYTQNVSGSPSGGSATVSLNLTAYSGYTATATYLIMSTGLDEPYGFSEAYYIYGLTPGNYTMNDFMERYGDGGEDELKPTTRVFIITALSIVLGVALAFWVMEAGIIAALIIWVLGAWFGWVHWTYGILVIFGLLGTLLWGVRR